MKTIRKIFIGIAIVVVVVVLCAVAVGGYAYHLFGDQVRAVQSVREVTPELY